MIPEASDIEINPVIVTLNDVWAVDGKIIMKEIKEKKTPTPPKMKMATATKHEVLAAYFHYYEVETEEPLDFQPGQYISVKVAPDAVRAYSIATKLGPNKFALLVDIRPGGPGSKFFEHLQPGDKIPFLGPFGAFTLKLDDEVENFLFLGTGSGMSALRCMIDAALKEHNVKKPMKLYFGLTYPHEIFWQDYFEQLKKDYPNFDYDIAIFKPDESWTGHTGFVTEYVKQDFPDAGKCAAYLCGHRAMIADATELLQANGCPKERIYTERFV
jgi:NAD(P)H-flavin reductase